MSMFSPKIPREQPVPAPVRMAEKTNRLETPDEQRRRTERRPTGRDQFRIDLNAPQTGGSGLNLPRI